MLFSIIIPVYNTDKYLTECIESVLSQEFKDFEIILINDGSTDKSLDICKKYHQRYSNILLASQPNLGASVARNTGISLSHGKYIFFLDSDDRMAPGILNKVKLITSSQKLDLVIGKFDYLKENIKSSNYIFNFKNSNNIYDFVKYCINNKIQIPWNPYQYFIKRNIIQKNRLSFNPKIKVAEDCDFFFLFLKFVKSFKVTNLTFVEYRSNRPGSLIKKQNSVNVLSQIQIFYKLAYRFTSEPIIHDFFVNKTISVFILIAAIKNKNDREDCYKYAQKYIDIFEEKINIKYYPFKFLIGLLGLRMACKIYYEIKIRL